MAAPGEHLTVIYVKDSGIYVRLSRSVFGKNEAGSAFSRIFCIWIEEKQWEADMKNKTVSLLVILAFLLTVSLALSNYMLQYSMAHRLAKLALSGDTFRSQQLSDSAVSALTALAQENTGLSVGELLTAAQATGGPGSLRTLASWESTALARWEQQLLRYEPDGFERVSRAYAAIWDDVECFPVAEAGINYENSWMFERTYGGVRGHEGTDLMPSQNLSGYYKIVSMTDGVVEKIGWLPRGGYRIGIRSPSGGYYYYAHLAGYSTDFQIGDTVEAGDCLGTMGDTGYGPEGTTGQFPVHLHLGIYIATDTVPELSVNPYWVLRYIG
jgi:murein DD-endopeptidase MepM/ murein hydrolase activator NlpD